MITDIPVYELPKLPDNEEFNLRFPENNFLRIDYEVEESEYGYYYIIEAYLGDFDVTEYLTKDDLVFIEQWLDKEFHDEMVDRHI